MIKNYIIVDDDPIHNAICKMVLDRTLGEVNTVTFTMPEKGIRFIQHEYSKSTEPTILFLDINLSAHTGWEFMEEYETLSEDIKKNIHIYVLSSSINQSDKDKAESNSHIKGFLSKPLMNKTVLSLADM